MEIVFFQNGYKKLKTQIDGNKGFDGVYVKTKGGCDPSAPGCDVIDVIIGEAKQRAPSVDPNIDEVVSLSPDSRAGYDQMTDDWIDAVINVMTNNTDQSIKNTATKMLEYKA